MVNNKITLKTTANEEVVRSTEIFNISVDLRNKSININEQETVVDLSGEEIPLQEKYSHFGFGEPSPNSAPIPGQLNESNEPKRIRREQLAQDIFNIIAAYRLEVYDESNTE